MRCEVMRDEVDIIASIFSFSIISNATSVASFFQYFMLSGYANISPESTDFLFRWNALHELQDMRDDIESICLSELCLFGRP